MKNKIVYFKPTFQTYYNEIIETSAVIKAVRNNTEDIYYKTIFNVLIQTLEFAKSNLINVDGQARFKRVLTKEVISKHIFSHEYGAEQVDKIFEMLDDLGSLPNLDKYLFNINSQLVI